MAKMNRLNIAEVNLRIQTVKSPQIIVECIKNRKIQYFGLTWFEIDEVPSRTEEINVDLNPMWWL